MSEWIDITFPLRTGMVHWPGDPEVNTARMSDMDRGDVCNVRMFSMSAHTGTHMDAPLHFIADGTPLEQMPLDATVGPARIIAITNERLITPEEITQHDPQPGERLLFKTRNSRDCWRNDDFVKDFVYIGAPAAQFLAESKVRTVGVDYLSIGAYEGDGAETHRILLGAGIWAIEGLNLSGVDPGRYELICLPMKVENGDGAPARAIVKKIP